MGRKAGIMRINPKNFGRRNRPCLSEMLNYLACLKKFNFNDDHCALERSALSHCMELQEKNPMEFNKEDSSKRKGELIGWYDRCDEINWDQEIITNAILCKYLGKRSPASPVSQTSTWWASNLKYVSPKIHPKRMRRANRTVSELTLQRNCK